MTRRTHRWLVAGAVGLALGTAAGTLPGHHAAHEGGSFYASEQAAIEAAAQAPAGDRIREAAAEVRRDGFHVGPELRGALTPAEVERVERTIAEADVPLFVVWWATTSYGGYYLASDALDQLRAAVGEDGVYAVLEPGRPAALGAVGFEHVYVDENLKGRRAVALQRYVEALADVVPERPRPAGESRSDYWGGPGGGIAAGVLMVAVGFPVVVLLVWILGRLARRRYPEGGRP